MFCSQSTPCTVKKTFEAAAETGNVLLAQVKANQPLLLEAVQTLATSQPPADRIETVDRRRHGRQEHRLVEVFEVASPLDPEWDDLIASAARVTRLTWHKDSQSGLWHATEDQAFYVCQTGLSAAAFATVIRGHWGIETRSHYVRDYVRDVTFLEDRSRIRTKPGHFARFRSLALNLLRANGINNVNQELYANALNIENLLSYRVT